MSCMVVEEYKPHLHIVINEKNLGLRLRRTKSCSNELVARMDTDDISKPERCEKQLKRFEEKPERRLLVHIDEFVGDPCNVISQRRYRQLQRLFMSMRRSAHF